MLHLSAFILFKTALPFYVPEIMTLTAFMMLIFEHGKMDTLKAG
jgi:hypothetical protein